MNAGSPTTAASSFGHGRSVFQPTRCSSRWKSPLAMAGHPAAATQPKSVSRLKSSKRSTRDAARGGRRTRRCRACSGQLLRRVRVGGDERRPCARAAASADSRPTERSTCSRSPTATTCAASNGSRSSYVSSRPGTTRRPYRRRARSPPPHLGQVRRMVARMHLAPLARRVVGDREHVEAATAVEVAELPHREVAVAPGRVGVELAEKRARLRRHAPNLRCISRVSRGVSEPLRVLHEDVPTRRSRSCRRCPRRSSTRRTGSACSSRRTASGSARRDRR